jgi:protein phosphatase
MMFIVGGKGADLNDPMHLDIYDTETSQWTSIESGQRHRHVSWAFGGNIFLHGGFGSPANNLPVADIYMINLHRALEKYPNLTENLSYYSNTAGSLNVSASNSGAPSPVMSGANTPSTTPQRTVAGNAGMAGRNPIDVSRSTMGSGASSTMQASRIGGGDKFKVNINVRHDDQMMMEAPTSLCDDFLNKLLKPKDYINVPDGNKFFFSSQQIISLCDQAEEIIKNQPMVLRFESPAMIFGDIHGQYSDLMRFFDLWGAPYNTYTGKDDRIQYFDYLFLGDFVDRGNHCLETICLLLALKVKYPDQIHLIRGNHEDRNINDGFGFSEECAQRLDEDPGRPNSVFNRFNLLFEYLPLAAIIDEKILCLHGGIGANLQRVEQIEALDNLRPLTVVHEVKTDTDKLVVDILWSDPTENDNEFGIHPNHVRDPEGTGNIVKFGPDIVKKFLKANNMLKIIRAHECVNDGMEKFAGGDLITIFSATNYCGKHKNAGAMLCLKKNYEFMPRLIYPQSLATNNWIEDEDMLRNRPPTPPRWRENGM